MTRAMPRKAQRAPNEHEIKGCHPVTMNAPDEGGYPGNGWRESYAYIPMCASNADQHLLRSAAIDPQGNQSRRIVGQ